MCQDGVVLVVSIVEVGIRTTTKTVHTTLSEVPAKVKSVLEDVIRYSPPKRKSLLVLSKTVVCPTCARVENFRSICWQVVSGGPFEWFHEFSILVAFFKQL